jgi:hypothetical protein
VLLFKDGKQMAMRSTDTFGDFKFDGLDPNSGRYRVEVSHPTYGASTVDLDVEESIYAGTIALHEAARA